MRGLLPQSFDPSAEDDDEFDPRIADGIFSTISAVRSVDPSSTTTHLDGKTVCAIID